MLTQRTQNEQQNMFVRKAQANRDGLYLNIPNEWIQLADVKKSDALNCSVIQNGDNEFYLLVSKLQEAL